MQQNNPIVTLFKKLQNVILYIFPPFISILYLSIPEKFELNLVIIYSGFILSALIISAFGYFLNDATDVKIDQLARKKNAASGFSIIQRILISLFLLSSGLGVFYFCVDKFIPFFLLILQVVALLFYSIPPIRLKNNPYLGPLTDSHYGHIIPVFIALTTFFTIQKEYWYLLTPMYVLLLAKGLRNILLHQLDDRKTDLLAGIKTFPIIKGPVTTLNIINRLLLPIELILIIVLLTMGFKSFPLIIYGFGAFLIFTFLNFSGWKFFKLPPRQLRFKFLFFLNDFYELWLPLCCLWSTDLNAYVKAGLSILHLIFFFNSTKKLLLDIKKIFQNFGWSKAN